jgi:hypothetical protein
VPHDGPYALVYDVELKQPGCVLLQAALGGTVPSDLFSELFPAETWLLAPTDKMTVYRTTREQLFIVASKTNKRSK